MKEAITIDDVKKVEIRVGEIRSAEKIAGSDKLLKLSVSFGLKPSIEPQSGSADQPSETVEAAAEPLGGSAAAEEEIRQVLSGIAAYFPDPAMLVGKRCPFVTNLAPRSMMGLESQAMILATGGGEMPFHVFETGAEPGSFVN